ncbi:MAG: apolipoprotein N-acyltransferase [Aurantimicrobium sp.]|nr:apolipoprotein N-acyltransferase [Aurantimicrobium sp.]
MISRWRRRLPLLAAIPVAAIGGLTLSASFPEPGWWFLAVPGVALVVWSLAGRRWWTALLVGLASGVAFWLPLIDWLTLYLGPVPWLALATVMILWQVMWAILAAFVLNNGARLWRTPRAQVGFIPLVIAGLWVAREGISSVWPQGGFSWGRVAQSQADGIFGHLVPWLSTAGLTFVLVWLGATIVVLLRTEGARWLWSVPVVATVCALLVPAFPIATSGSMRVGAVQGNSDAGLFSDYTPGEILNDHLAASEALVGKRLDVVVWPENGNDIDPLRDKISAGLVNDVAVRLDAPLVFGTITHPDPDTYFNSSLVWTPGEGVTAQYDKIHPVPFAEYMPARDFFYALAPDLVGLVTRDYSFGTRSNVVVIEETPVGLSICFDITDDQQAYDMQREGAQIIFAQTNNADFGRTDESLQQLAIARLRAMEMGRTVVNISTVGVSAIIAPDGSTIEELPRFTAGAMYAEVPLSTTATPAMVAGRAIELLLAAIGIAGLAIVGTVAVWAAPIKTRRRASPGRGERADTAGAPAE